MSSINTSIDPEFSAHACSFFGDQDQNPSCDTPFSEPADQNSILLDRVGRRTNYSSASRSCQQEISRGALSYFSGNLSAVTTVSFDMWKRNQGTW